MFPLLNYLQLISIKMHINFSSISQKNKNKFSSDFLKNKNVKNLENLDIRL